MGAARDFVDLLVGRGYGFFAGVPCSILDTTIAELERRKDLGYIAATREDLAVGMAVGAHLAGRKAVVLMQNSGLENSLNALTSLVQIYDIPMLLVVSYRGHQGNDVPEHLVMGRILEPLLDLVGLQWQLLDAARMKDQVSAIDESIESSRQPGVLVVRKGVLE